MIPKHLIDVHVHLNNYHEAKRRPTADNVATLVDKLAIHDKPGAMDKLMSH